MGRKSVSVTRRPGRVPGRVIVGLLLLMASAVSAETLVVIKTNLGDITLALNEEAAPVTVANFLSYVDDDAFDGTIFHRVIEGFMVQGGGYLPDLTEAPEREMILNEADNGLKNDRGTIAMARSDGIDSAARQFFINVTKNRSLNHSKRSCTREDMAKIEAQRERGIRKPQTCKSFGYAVFGRVNAGMDVVDQIERKETRTVGPFNDLPVTPIVVLAVERLTQDSNP